MKYKTAKILLLMSGLPGYAVAQCTLTTDSLNFGQYDSLYLTALHRAVSVQVVCPEDVLYRIGIDIGISGNGNFSARTLRSPENSRPLLYNLYLDPNHSRVWGDGTSSTSVINDIGNGQQKSYSVFSKVFANQSVPPGVYSDAVTIVVEW